MDHEPKRQRVQQRPRETIEAMLRSNVPQQVGEALWSAAYYDPDWRWVQTQCLYFLTHADVSVRRSAATCLGLVAAFHKKLDLDIVLPAIRRAAEDPEVKAWAEDTLGDIQHTFSSN